MLFSSISFLYYFLPLTLFFYFAVPGKLKNTVLLLCSIVFYAWGEPKYIFLMGISILLGYGFGLLVEKYRESLLGRSFCAVSVCISLSFLVCFKYTDFFIENFNAVTGLSVPLLRIALPIGISFYTFKLASYVLDVYGKKVRAERKFTDFGTYLCMFPQLIAGPIVKYTDMAGQLKKRKYLSENLEEGLKTFTLGLASKMLLANPCGAFWNRVQVIGFESISTGMAWLGAFSFTFQIYFDFNGYSLMAMGLCRMLGFSIRPNFNQPYLSKSLTEFWRRWHVSLGTWFREYIYIPLGGNRKGKPVWVRNMFIVWLLTGVWHGAEWNFFLWGVFLFLVLMLEKLLWLPFLEKSRIFSRIYMAALIPISWMLFAITDIKELFVYLGRMFGVGTVALSGNALHTELIMAFKSCGVQWLLCILLILPFPARWYEKHKKQRICIFLLLCIFWISVYQIIYTKSNPFLYFRF